uniref:OBP7 n=1 Tax=Eupeodes corollae TaxID=290404 RepID=A0A8F9WLQ2_9MUSC|nr:OBP7 [Eupeodes corollae]
MKFFIILVTLVALTAAKYELKSREEWFNIQDYCDERFKVSPEFREKHKDDKYVPKEIFRTILCYLRGLELWNDSEGFSIDKLMVGLESVKDNIKNYNAVILRQSLAQCTSDKNTEGIAPFDWAYRCFKCFTDNRYIMEAFKVATFYKEDKKDADE